MSKQDWSEFKQRILVIRTMGEVYNAWSTRENITSWFLERAIYTSKNGVRDRLEPIEKGDNFSWKWHNWEAVITLVLLLEKAGS